MTYGFVRSVAEHPFGRLVPGVDDALEILAVNRDVRGLDDCGQVGSFAELVLGQGSSSEAKANSAPAPQR
jgi:hypothetical protein